ncbi:hypothetical protein [Geoanaerobacter pelophilus]|uniref:hypothetical protein n=1 Tax=Geoanaerobacter pelophilus TaxID=60036 RepID=UPI00117AD9E0|nr:hypothetical protein [Geoanaerobacter pelophilus]
MEKYVSAITPEQVSLLKDAVDLAKVSIPAIVTLLACYLAFRFSTRLARYNKSLEFKQKQITEFYSPMIGCLKNIQSHSELRLELSNAASEAWREIIDAAPKPFLDHKNEFKPFEKLIEYDNIKFREELLPLYDRMLSIFTENYWLAEEPTKAHYSELCRYVEVWHRWLGDALPREVMLKAEHSEERLFPLYDDLEKQMFNLRNTIANG